MRAFRHLGRAGEAVRCAARVWNWPGVACRYLKLAGGYPMAFRTRSGLAVELGSYHDLVTAWVVFCRDEYRVSADSGLVIDVGANIGLFTLRAAQTAPAARVVAVEPFPASFDRLRRAVADNRLTDRVTCWRVAVAGSAGVRHMSTAWASQLSGLFPAGGPIPDASVAVEAITLPGLLARVRAAHPGRPIDFLKIDVEGAEYEFLLGLPAGTLADVRAVGMEYHPNGDKAALFTALSGHGLACVADAPAGANSGVAHFARVGLP
jgi:FkbM family methyltransferase